MIRTIAFAGYRSLRDVRIGLSRLTVVTGGNGTGKSNVYRALKLLVDAAEGRLAGSLAREGGMPSAMWAGEQGPRRAKVSEGKRISIGFGDETTAYELRLGLPPPGYPFACDPLVKEETIRTLQKPKINLLERRNESAMLRELDGKPITYAATVDAFESILSQVTEPHRYPVLSIVRERLRRWRFYHQFRTDPDSPMRAPHVGARTLALAHDGHDLAAALATIEAQGDGNALDEAVADAFGGSSLDVGAVGARFAVGLSTPGVSRPLDAAELSDGTLRYLALLAALHSPRPPELLVLNEPETSLHPRLVEPLARQIIAASRQTQIIVVSHAAPLVDAVAAARDATRVELVKRDGATDVANRAMSDVPAWSWTT